MCSRAVPSRENPLAIVPDADGLSSEEMQRIAAEMNLSETAFTLRPTDVQALCRLRIFTPTAELPLAGHPVVGAFFVLAKRGELGLGEALRQLGTGVLRIHQECGAGVLPVDIRVADGEVEQVVMTQAPPRFFSEFTGREALAACLGLGPEELLPNDTPAQVVSTAIPQLMVPVRSLRSVERIQLDPVATRALLNDEAISSDCMMVFSTETVRDESAAHARMFAPGLGVTEDAATGSAAGRARRLAGPARAGRQRRSRPGSARRRTGLRDRPPERDPCRGRAGENGRPSLVRVGGQAVEVAEGVLRIPPGPSRTR